MLKGCQKRVIWVRNPESKGFDEAYFILSDTPGCDGCKENDMLKEANKIISASPFAGYYGLAQKSSGKRIIFSIGERLKWFALGATVTSVCAIIGYIVA